MAGSRDLIVWLLKQRPDAVNIPNQDGRTLLHLAALNNQIEICKVYRYLIHERQQKTSLTKSWIVSSKASLY